MRWETAPNWSSLSLVVVRFCYLQHSHTGKGKPTEIFRGEGGWGRVKQEKKPERVGEDGEIVKDRAPLCVYLCVRVCVCALQNSENQSEITLALKQCLLWLTFLPESFKMHSLLQNALVERGETEAQEKRVKCDCSKCHHIFIMQYIFMIWQSRRENITVVLCNSSVLPQFWFTMQFWPDVSNQDMHQFLGIIHLVGLVSSQVDAVWCRCYWKGTRMLTK